MKGNNVEAFAILVQRTNIEEDNKYKEGYIEAILNANRIENYQKDYFTGQYREYVYITDGIIQTQILNMLDSKEIKYKKAKVATTISMD